MNDFKRNTLRKLMITAPSSNTGKTLISTALIKLFRELDLQVMGAKTGPDYIDAEYLTYASGKKSENFDLFLMDDDLIKKKINKIAVDNDVLLVEGVMGYFDGSGNTFEASSFDLSKKFDIGAILLYEPEGEMFTMVPKIKGMVDFSEGQIKGVIFNKTSKKIYDMIAPQIEKYVGISALGYIPNDKRLEIHERSLGLIRPKEVEDITERLDLITKQMKKTVDIRGVLMAATQQTSEQDRAEENPFKKYKILMAKDDAFCFHYESELYDAATFFSPLNDKEIPEDTDLVVIGGGYPELFRFKLSNNESMINSLREYHRKGGRILAYGGGLIYLSKRIGEVPMVGIFPGLSSMTKNLVHFGYQKAVIEDEWLGTQRGEFNVREYHRGIYETSSRSMLMLSKPNDEKGETRHSDGYKERNAYGSYSHAHPDAISKMILQFLERKV